MLAGRIPDKIWQKIQSIIWTFRFLPFPMRPLKSGGLAAKLTGLPPVSEAIVDPNTVDEKFAGGNSGPTIFSTPPISDDALIYE